VQIVIGNSRKMKKKKVIWLLQKPTTPEPKDTKMVEMPDKEFKVFTWF
jgi:hypothetical protein